MNTSELWRKSQILNIILRGCSVWYILKENNKLFFVIETEDGSVCAFDINEEEYKFLEELKIESRR